MTWKKSSVSALTLSLCLVSVMVSSAAAPLRPSPSHEGNAIPTSPPTEHVILFVLEGFSQESLKGGTMPTLSKLIKEGSLTWSASADQPALR